ncbi:MAG: hypothetical protein B6244_06235 [Candidatus Cloacimonetes bacterium 4572_55]|nr:MAG: hypothetical protein B6244_06235 [Candidatus Cloacimonetes bacterium 4572_55]
MGTTTEASPIQWTCSGGTPTSDSDETTASLAQDGVETHLFAPTWTAPNMPRDYTAIFFTALGTDENPANDTTTVIITVMPAGIVQIGDGTLEKGLPIYPGFNYTYSQSIYLQNEIGTGNQRISKLYYYYNGNSAWGPDDIVVYMGHTSETDFVDNWDWIPVANLTEVYNGQFSVPAVEGWVEIILNYPFIYNNTDNLVIAVDENTASTHSGLNKFYCTSAATDRSLSYIDYSDDCALSGQPILTIFIPMSGFNSRIYRWVISAHCPTVRTVPPCPIPLSSAVLC